MGGGLPAAAFGGRAEIMARLAPAGPVYQAGTLSGNPLACAAGLATLRPAPTRSTPRCDETAATVARAGRRGADHRRRAAPACSSAGNMFSVFFTDDARCATTTTPATQDVAAFTAFFHAMLARGVYLPPSRVRGLVRLGRASTTTRWSRRRRAAARPRRGRGRARPAR